MNPTGIPSDIAEKIVPLSDNEELIREKTGVAPGKSYGQMFRLTPTVSDIVDKFGIVGPDGVQLLVMGTVKDGGSGCMCPSNALLRVLVQHLLIQREDILVMDMVAGDFATTNDYEGYNLRNSGARNAYLPGIGV